MFKDNEANMNDYFSLPNPGLESYLNKTRTGNSQEYRTVFAKGDSLEKVLADWKPTIEQIGETWPTLLEFENDLAKKVGPLSIQKPLSERMDDIRSYYDSILLESKPISHAAEAAVIREWSSLRGLEPRGQKRVIDLMKKSTSSGNPYFIKRRAATDKTYPVRLEIQYPNVFQFLTEEEKEWKSAAILGWRGQEGGPTDDDVKQRVVWMFPYGVNIRELQVYQPSIELAQRSNLVPAWVSMESVDQRVTRLFDTKGKNDLIICTDFSKFDQHFNADMQNAAKSILSALLNNSSASREWLTNVFPVKYEIPLIIDTNRIILGKHGMGSGSGGTNFDETLTHRALQYEAALNKGQRLNPNSQCLGDDGILSYPGINVEDVMQTYTSHRSSNEF